MLRRWYAWTLPVTCLAMMLGCGKEASVTSEATPDSSPRTFAQRTSQPPSASDAYDAGASTLEAAASPMPAADEIASESKVIADFRSRAPHPNQSPDTGHGPGMSGDKHDLIVESSFIPVREQPLSTFSIDVDTASYSKTRMHLLQQNQLPPIDAVRIEEMINYFHYDYSPPTGEHPFSVNVEVASAPWCPENRLARIGLKGRDLQQQRPSSNLVFLVDVSGSMDYCNKLPLLKQGLQMLTSQLGENDRVSIVVYAGAAGLVLPPTLGSDKHRIMQALDQLHAGGSTNGGQGIQLAYQVAKQNLLKGGVNRVILCSDGDFNVGTTSTGDLVRLAEKEAKAGVFLSVLGFGMGNHNDAMLEQLSNKANGNYAFIDNEAEARKVLCDQINSTLVTIAKDVKIQIEFNPAHVAAYRLIGYENRHLEAHEFNDDRKDAGEIGAGHTVTALYEIIPVGEATDSGLATVDPLKYQKTQPETAGGDELMTVKLRYKQPDASKSQLVVAPVKNSLIQFEEATSDFKFASAVAGFGMLLRNSKHLQSTNYASILAIADANRGADKHGYRGEFIKMIAAAGRLKGEPLAATNWEPPLREPPIHEPAIAQTRPAPVYYYSTQHRSPAFASTLVIGGVVLSIVLIVSTTLAAIIVGARFLVLPNDSQPQHNAWPCTEKQRACDVAKPPVRASRIFT